MNEILTQWLNPCKKGIAYDTTDEISKLRGRINDVVAKGHLLFQEYLFEAIYLQLKKVQSKKILVSKYNQ